MNDSHQKYKNWHLLFVLSILHVFIAFLTNKLLTTQEVFYNSYIEKVSLESIDKYFQIHQKWFWISYMFNPVILTLKIFIIGSLIDAGLFFFNYDIKFKKIVRIVLKAEYLFVAVGLIKIIWFIIFQQSYDLLDLQYYKPLSVINIVGYKGLEAWLVYPLQVLNLFEVAYWFVLAHLLGKELKFSINKGLIIIASSYGIGLLIWMVSVMFLTLNMS